MCCEARSSIAGCGCVGGLAHRRIGEHRLPARTWIRQVPLGWVGESSLRHLLAKAGEARIACQKRLLIVIAVRDEFQHGFVTSGQRGICVMYKIRLGRACIEFVQQQNPLCVPYSVLRVSGCCFFLFLVRYGCTVVRCILQLHETSFYSGLEGRKGGN